MLFNSMDAFFSYGLLFGERVYWRFVREFLPKTQQELLRAEWGDVDNRRLSIAWLKDAFNKGTLHFQMLSFRNNRGGYGKLIVLSIFQSTLNFRVEPTQAVVVEPPVTPVVMERARRRKRAESDHSQPTILNETPPAAVHILALPSQLDQVLRKTISQVQIESDGVQPMSFDSLLQYDDLQQNKYNEEDVLVEGEVVLDSGDILNLAMNVYVDEGERLLRMFYVYQRFAAGMPLARFLAITDHNIYIVAQNVVLDESVQQGVFEEGGSRNVSYKAHVIIPLSTLDYIAVSTDSQVIVLYAKSGMFFRTINETNGNKDKTCAIATGDLQLGNAIVKAITTISVSGNREPPAVFTDSTPYCLMIKRYLAKELNGSPHIELCHFSLVYWRESSATLEKQSAENVGYLYRRMVFPNWWRRPQAEWIQSYFVLIGSKIYVFADSTCKEGEMVINLCNCSETHELDLRNDCQWGLELVLPDGNLQLQCPTKDEMNKWIHSVNLAMNSQNDDDAAACMVMITNTDLVVAQEGEKCFTDGFIRTLVAFPLPDIRSGWIVHAESHETLVLRVDAMYQWFIFRSPDELSRMVKTLSEYPIPLLEISHNNKDKVPAYILNHCRKMPNFWHKVVLAAEGLDSEL
uniref:PH domain-containing protein n=1 Tax=Angiostrongylus cantonensis TaxID=6313 RepID=A0A0K0DKF2_ANGCA